MLIAKLEIARYARHCLAAVWNVFLFRRIGGALDELLRVGVWFGDRFSF